MFPKHILSTRLITNDSFLFFQIIGNSIPFRKAGYLLCHTIAQRTDYLLDKVNYLSWSRIFLEPKPFDINRFVTPKRHSQLNDGTTC